MKVIPQSIKDVLLIEGSCFKDERGYFFESFQEEKFNKILPKGPWRWVQDNESFSKKGVLRGLHYQNPKAQGKLIRVIRGRVVDVAVDLRRSSPTFKKYVMVSLQEGDFQWLWIPPGFAHGFLALEDTLLSYKVTEFYAPLVEHTLLWNDPALGIEWPLSELGESFSAIREDPLRESFVPLVSPKDQKGLSIGQAPLFD